MSAPATRATVGCRLLAVRAWALSSDWWSLATSSIMTPRGSLLGPAVDRGQRPLLTTAVRRVGLVRREPWARVSPATLGAYESARNVGIISTLPHPQASTASRHVSEPDRPQIRTFHPPRGLVARAAELTRGGAMDRGTSQVVLSSAAVTGCAARPIARASLATGPGGRPRPWACRVSRRRARAPSRSPGPARQLVRRRPRHRTPVDAR